MNTTTTRTSRRTFLKLGLAGLAGAAWAASHGGRVAAASVDGERREWVKPEPAAPLFATTPANPTVALTFDDGFVNVARLLDVCRAAGVTLTLFPIGSQIEKDPALWQQAVADGHELGCHTYHHQPLGGQPYAVVAAELAQFLDVVHTQLGEVPVRFFRPPYGSGWNDTALKTAAADAGMRVVMWNRTNTMKQFAAKPGWREVVASFKQQARAGDVFLYHFNWQEVEALPAIFDLCARWGWQVGGVQA